MKPICCGDRRDAELLLAASDEGLTIDQVNPCWFQTPVAPYAASLVEHVEVESKRLLEAFYDLQSRFDFVVVEGVGGWLVPIRQDRFISDLAHDLNLPVLIVVQNRLGCLNHTLLTHRSVESYRCSTLGVVLNDSAGVKDIGSATNAEILARLITVPVVSMLNEADVELPKVWLELLADSHQSLSQSRTHV
jgi:dethiobiotin synthetase